jgi:hypothetical protein
MENIYAIVPYRFFKKSFNFLKTQSNFDAVYLIVMRYLAKKTDHLCYNNLTLFNQRVTLLEY